MALHSSPSTRSEPILGTPRKDRMAIDASTKATKSVTPRKRPADFYSSSPILTSSESGSSPLTQSHYGRSRFQERLRRTSCSPFASSPPTFSTPEDHSHADVVAPETPSKRRVRPGLGRTSQWQDETKHPIPETIRKESLDEPEDASLSSTGLSERFSQLSTGAYPSKRVRYDHDTSRPGEEPPRATETIAPETPGEQQTGCFQLLDSSAPDVVTPNEETGKDLTGRNITADNAQSILLPQACVFAANLPRSEPDEAITSALETAFSRFGQCWVKVLRSHNDQMPYAFVQYKTSEEAHVAVKQGRGTDVLGRPCRTEVARAHRAVYVTRRDGACPTHDEIMTLLSPFGEVEAVVFPSETEIHVHDLQPGGWARFRIFGDCKDAISQLQTNTVYYVRQAKQLAPKGIVFQNDGSHGPHRVNFNRLHSICVRWLPSEVHKSQVYERFKLHGQIQHIGLRTVYPVSGFNVEAAVLYSTWSEAERAVNEEDNLVVVRQGLKRRLKVDYMANQTEYSRSNTQTRERVHPHSKSERRFDRSFPSNSVPPIQSPAMGFWMPSMPDADVVWQQGMNNAFGFQLSMNGIGGPMLAPFYGMPVQYFPGQAIRSCEPNSNIPKHRSKPGNKTKSYQCRTTAAEAPVQMQQETHPGLHAKGGLSIPSGFMDSIDAANSTDAMSSRPAGSEAADWQA